MRKMLKICVLLALGVFIEFGINACSREPEKSSIPESEKPPATVLEPPKSASPKVQQAWRDLKWLKSAMLRYRRDVGELPPRGDNCPACTQVEPDGSITTLIGHGSGRYPKPHMTEVEQVLMKKDGRGWKGPYIKKPIPEDPWGMEYTYDDNDPKGANAGDTYLWSAGADKVYGNSDDVRILVLTRKGTETR